MTLPRSSALALLVLLALAGCSAATPTPDTPAEASPEAPAAAPAEQPDQESEPATEEATGPEIPSNTLRWTTASEVDNFGFDVYRSESEEGPFERITERPIQGAGTTDLPSEYVFVDEEIDPRNAYYYYVESISLQGERELFTPVIRAKPKVGEEDSDGE